MWFTRKSKALSQLTESQLKEIRRILIIQHKPFGDVLLNTGFLPELRRRFPDAQIDYLVQRPYLTILEDNPHIDDLIIMEKKKGWRNYLEQFRTVPKIRKRKYDLIIDQLRGASSARQVIFSGAKYKLGYIRRRLNCLYNVRVERRQLRYYSRIKFDLLAPLGIEEVEHNLEYHIRDESYEYIERWINQSGLAKKELIALSAGTPVKRKQWSLLNFAAVGDLIQKSTRFKIVILWAPNEIEDAQRVKDLMTTDVILAPPTSFNQAGAFLNYSNMLICNDGGLNHLAVSQNTPSIAIFMPGTNPRKWCAWHKDGYYYFKVDESGSNISPQQVFERVDDYFSRRESLSADRIRHERRKP